MISDKADKSQLKVLPQRAMSIHNSRPCFGRANGITAEITEERTYANQILDQLNEYKESVSTWQRFDINGLTIGKSGPL